MTRAETLAVIIFCACALPASGAEVGAEVSLPPAIGGLGAAAALSAPIIAAPAGPNMGALSLPDVSAGAVIFDGAKPAAVQAAEVAAAPAAPAGLDQWLSTERGVALQRMENNISPAGAAPGSVAASPSHQNPDYWYNWRRDAALTMNVVVGLYRDAQDPAQKQKYLQMLTDYASFVQKEQANPGQAGLGEPKYNMDGTPFTGPWGRPQNDAPAEEASTLIYFASTLMAQGKSDQAKALYGDFNTGIKADLEYVSHHWQDSSFDVWEEQNAHHFDTAVAQRTAMLEGAWFARQMNDPGAADWYQQQADALDAEIAKHWDPQKGYIQSAVGYVGGLNTKTSDLDSAVILAAIHRQPIDDAFPSQDQTFSASDSRVLATALRLKQTFKSEYPINQNPQQPGVAIGRYPEDSYFGGNAWVISTDGFAQLYYMAALQFLQKGQIPIDSVDLPFFQDLLSGDPAGATLTAGTTLQAGQPLFDKVILALKAGGDQYLECVQFHANPDGSLSEQMNKDNGYMMSANDLTWNYASLLSALNARDALAGQLGSLASSK